MHRLGLLLVPGLVGCGGDCARVTVFVDRDRDGSGDDAFSAEGCAEAGEVLDPGFSFQGGDCDDRDADIRPDAAEVCDGLDNDCDGLVDGEDDSLPARWHRDADGDGYGEMGAGIACPDSADGYVTDDTDCDDSDASINPAVAADGAGGADRNCSGSLEDLPAIYVLSSERFGVDMVTGDFDGDGVDDLLAGAWLASSGGYAQNGKAYLVYGPITSGPVDDNAHVVMTALEDDAHAGFGVAHEPATSRAADRRWSDLDGDGYAEAVFGADTETTSAGQKAGGVRILFSGQRHDSASAQAALLHVAGDGFRGRLGRGLSFVGDIDDDGAPDLFAGAVDYRDGDDVPVGAGFLLSGAALSQVEGDSASLSEVSLTLWGHQADSLLGYAGAVGADVDGDGFTDLLTSANKESSASAQGSVYLLTGPVTSDRALSEDAGILYGEAGYASRFGTSMTADDLDGDGYDDVMVGAAGAGEIPGGRLWILRGGADASAWSGGTVDTVGADSILCRELEVAFGSAVESLDADGDGHPDLIVSAEQWGSGDGAVFVFSGPIRGTLDLDDAERSLIRTDTEADLLAGDVLAVSDSLRGTAGPVVAISAHQDIPDGVSDYGNGAIYLLDLSP